MHFRVKMYLSLIQFIYNRSREVIFMLNQRYRAFSISAAEGSFTRAAEIMHYSPSAVSQLVSALEKELGFTLLLRHRRGVALTSEGATVLPVIRELLHQEERLEQLTADLQGLSVGMINIGAYSSIASHWLPGLINHFMTEYPGIKISMMEGIRQENEEWLNNHLVDLAFFSYKKGMTYDWIPLADDPMVAVLPETHPRAGDDSYPLHEVRKESFIMPALGRDDDVLELFRKNRIDPKITFSTLENFAALALIEQGMGMSIMNDLITRNYQCRVVKLPLDPPQHISLGIAVPSLDSASPAVRRFIDFAVERLRK